ncbi:MAG: hypothetical protein HYZ37_16330 [Candidatus Solibacter usitatus]|nr:hypothetical protein [Candidatus Solibacter usitatus]
MITARTLILAVLAAGGCFAQQPAPAGKDATGKAPPAKKVAAKKAATPPPAKTIDDLKPPAGSKEIEPGVYRWIDARKQPWIFRRTPFGLTKYPESKTVPEPDPMPTDWTVTDAGDSLNFEKPYPFGGTLRWTRKKTELNDQEKHVWKLAQGKSPEPAK